MKRSVLYSLFCAVCALSLLWAAGCDSDDDPAPADGDTEVTDGDDNDTIVDGDTTDTVDEDITDTMDSTDQIMDPEPVELDEEPIVDGDDDPVEQAETDTVDDTELADDPAEEELTEQDAVSDEEMLEEEIEREKDETNTATTCDSTDDCADGYVCMYGYCVQTCLTTDDCPGNKVCLEGICRRPVTGECTSHDDCIDQYCVHGTCMNAGGSCSDDDDCIPGSVCAFDLCMMKGCDAQEDCPEASYCEAGNCYPTP